MFGFMQSASDLLVGRRYQLHRDVDGTGVSGTGLVADGFQFPDGTCVQRWRGAVASTAVFAGIEDVRAVHGHGGDTRVVWIDGGS